jgi:hypothetical protein
MLSELTLPAEQSASGLFFMILCFQVQRNLLRAQLFNQCRDALGNIFDQTPCFARRRQCSIFLSSSSHLAHMQRLFAEQPACVSNVPPERAAAPKSLSPNATAKAQSQWLID